VDTIPRLLRSKQDVLLFFRGAGVPASLTSDLSDQVLRNRDTINKFEITRTILTRLNTEGDVHLRERREVLRRVTQWEDYSTCWDSDRLEAAGLVEQVRHVVNVSDSFTRMNQEREAERRSRLAEQRAKQIESDRRRLQLQEVRRALFALFGEADAQKRGKALEGVLNQFFQISGILVREAFTLRGWNDEGVIEQIDGVVELDGAVYLVEMKWLKHRAGPGDVSQQLVRVFSRGEARGIIISGSGFTDAAVIACKEALAHRVVTMCELGEFVRILDNERDLRDVLNSKIRAAIVDKNPLFLTQ
jgi:restriction system protein